MSIDSIVNELRDSGVRNEYLLMKKAEQAMKDSDYIYGGLVKMRNNIQLFYSPKTDFQNINKAEFKLGRLKKEMSIKKQFQLDQYFMNFEQTIRDKYIYLDELKKHLIDHALGFNVKPELLKRFEETLKVYSDYKKQIVFQYNELNGEVVKYRPIIRLHEKLTLEQLYDFATEKSHTLWNREFDGEIKLERRFYVDLLGTYCSENKVIRMSEYSNATLPKEKVFDTLLHELVHWHLHTTGEPYDDEDERFIEECLRVGCGLSYSNSAQRAYDNYLSKVANS